MNKNGNSPELPDSTPNGDIHPPATPIHLPPPPPSASLRPAPLCHPESTVIHDRRRPAVSGDHRRHGPRCPRQAPRRSPARHHRAREGIRKLQDVVTPVVSNIFDSSGELAAAVASVEAVEKFLNPDWIQQFRHNIRSGPMLMVDANLNPRSIEVACQIAAEYGIPVWFEPVSVVKSRRIAPVVDSITCTFPNENELIAMANVLSSKGELFSIPQFATTQKELPIDQIFLMLKPAICVLLEKGIRLLIVTLGSNGVFLCFVEGLHLIKYLSKSKSSFSNKLYEVVNERCPSKLYASSVKSEPCCSHYYAYHFPAVPASVVSLTGAGDCLVGGIIASICAGLDILQSTAVGIAAAKAAVEAKDNVPAEYCLLKLAEDAEKVFVAARPLLLD